MLGIDDPWILGVYLLCVLSTVLCIAYGALKWNEGAENESKQALEELQWEKRKEEMEKKEMGED